MRLIDADALKEKAFFHEIDNVSYVEEEDIDNAPTVDAVPVVRCKDCKNWIQFCEAYATCNCGHGVTDMEFYCRDGERWKNEAD